MYCKLRNEFANTLVSDGKKGRGRRKTRMGENRQPKNNWFCKFSKTKAGILRFWAGEGLFNIMTNYGLKAGSR